MQVKVTSISSRGIDSFRGNPDQVLAQLLVKFPWAARRRDKSRPHDPGSLRDVLARLEGTQDLMVESSDG